MVKDDERAFFGELKRRTREAKPRPRAAGIAHPLPGREPGTILDIPIPRDVARELGIPEGRAEYLYGKWTRRGWFTYGVSARTGWLTEKGLAAELPGDRPSRPLDALDLPGSAPAAAVDRQDGEEPRRHGGPVGGEHVDPAPGDQPPGRHRVIAREADQPA